MKPKILILLLMCLLIPMGCEAVVRGEPTIDTTSQFRSHAAIWMGERKTEANIVYSGEGGLIVELFPGALSRPIIQEAWEGGSEITLGERKLSYPAGWASSTSIARLMRQSLTAQRNTTRHEGGVRGEGTASGIPFVIEAMEDENILLSLAFPTLDIKIELSDFVRELG